MTWTDRAGYNKEVGKDIELNRQVWVTVVPELQSFCQNYNTNENPTEAELELRLKQRLGLRWDAKETIFCGDVGYIQEICLGPAQTMKLPIMKLNWTSPSQLYLFQSVTSISNGLTSLKAHRLGMTDFHEPGWDTFTTGQKIEPPRWIQASSKTLAQILF